MVATPVRIKQIRFVTSAKVRRAWKTTWALCLYILLPHALLALYWMSITRGAVSIPVYFSRANTPVLQAEVEGRSCVLLIDTGSAVDLKIDSAFLESQARSSKTKQLANLFGEVKRVEECELKKVDICGVTWKKPWAVCLDNDQLVSWTPLGRSEHQTDGVIGVGLLSVQNLLLDLAHREIKLLKRPPEAIGNMVWCPIVSHDLLLAAVETDQGPMRILFDTGSTWNMFNKAPVRSACPACPNRLIIDGVDFEIVNWQTLDFPPYLGEVNAILGMEFIQQHLIYVDWKDNKLWIQRSDLG